MSDLTPEQLKVLASCYKLLLSLPDPSQETETEGVGDTPVPSVPAATPEANATFIVSASIATSMELEGTR